MALFLSETVNVRDADQGSATLDVWISEGESDPGQTIMEYRAAAEYTMICLDQEALWHLRYVIDRMIAAHETLAPVPQGWDKV
jgi:hypothetical protein